MKGDGSFIYGTGTDFSTDKTTNGVNLGEITSAIIGVTRKLNNQLSVNLALSWVGFDDGTTYALANPTANKKLTQVSTNFIYNPVKNISLGMEYTYGKRETFSDDEASQSRFDFMARYNF